MVSIGVAVDVGISVDIGTGVLVGTGIDVGYGVYVGRGVYVGAGLGVAITTGGCAGMESARTMDSAVLSSWRTWTTSCLVSVSVGTGVCVGAGAGPMPQATVNMVSNVTVISVAAYLLNGYLSYMPGSLRFERR